MGIGVRYICLHFIYSIQYIKCLVGVHCSVLGSEPAVYDTIGFSCKSTTTTQAHLSQSLGALSIH